MPHLIRTLNIDAPFYQYQTNLTGHQIPEDEYDLLADISTVYKRGGRPLTKEEQITSVDFYSNRPLKKLYPIHQIAEGAIIISPEVKQAIESLDGPDRHQMVEVEVSQRQKKLDFPYYLLNVYHTNQTIDLQSDGVEMAKGFDRKERPKVSRREGTELKLRADFQSDSHMWRDDQFSAAYLLISDELFELLNTDNLLARVPTKAVQ